MPMPSTVRPIPNPAPRAVPLKRARFWLVCLLFLCWALLIAFRLFWLQVVRHQEFMERAEKQQQRTFEVAPRRGILYDRNQRELAITVQVDSIFAVPSEIGDKQTAASALAAVVHTDPDDAQSSEEQITARLQAGRSFAWIARRVTPDVAARVKALIDSGALKGIYFQKEFQRFYPDNEIAAQVLGYVGLDDNGLGGLEQKFEPQLHGVPGRMYTALDARRHVLGSSESGVHTAGDAVQLRYVHRPRCAPPRARLQRERAPARPEPDAPHRREHPVSRRAGARARDAEHPGGHRH